MCEIAFEEWQLLADSPAPGWEVIEQLTRTASSEVLRLLVLEPDRNRAYRTRYRADAPIELSGGLEVTLRQALRRDGFVCLVVRRPELLRGGLRLYQRVQRRVLTGDALAWELGGQLVGVEELLEGGHHLMLVGHDGDPVFMLSRPAAT